MVQYCRSDDVGHSHSIGWISMTIWSLTAVPFIWRLLDEIEDEDIGVVIGTYDGSLKPPMMHCVPNC